jgi:hypothetical protein
MLPFKLGCTDDENKGITTSKGATTWRFKTGETKTRKGPPSFRIVGDGKCEITLIAIREGDASFDNIGNHSPLRLECEGFNEPLPLECLHWITY